MNSTNVELYDVVELKREHPCSKRSKLFQVVRLGADLKIMCLGCGNIILIDRLQFNKRLKRIVEHQKNILKI